MTDEQSEARNLQWERTGTVMIRQLSTGNFAMFPLGGFGREFWIGPGDQLANAYASRPAPPERHERAPQPKPHGIDLTKVKFSI